MTRVKQHLSAVEKLTARTAGRACYATFEIMRRHPGVTASELRQHMVMAFGLEALVGWDDQRAFHQKRDIAEGETIQ